ncbi:MULTISPECIES: hypothetical protein [unclassified Mesorhizobium]|uniref:hypothetical protein n=1 Tax=unclassified Mesorhizobium TaxID=325217 RepID=UPI000FD83F02|nr:MULTISPECIES: hypothetical protein [unclassified Mesorhizobium]TGT76148.1 hypothetical protein EN809_000545 [Mesorhizobium sp. M2E.F.Ca.ET.166.01.1.1]TGW02263.1 hypothetical protein EN797_000545 [Mesorhizobium sp. M2E.F.Ca.ET.154.01.1.1]
MQTANCYVEIGGDSGTTVPKYQITVSEIAVLRAIHGPDSIKEIEPTDDIKRSDRDEIKYLYEVYGRAKAAGSDTGIVATLFPGAAARAFQTLDELELPEEFFKAESRVKPKPAAPVKPGKAKKAADKDEDPAPGDVEAVLAEEDKLFD